MASNAAIRTRSSASVSRLAAAARPARVEGTHRLGGQQPDGGVRIVRRAPDLDREPSARVLVARGRQRREGTQPDVQPWIVGERRELGGERRRSLAPRELDADAGEPGVGAREEPQDLAVVDGRRRASRQPP